MWIVRFVFGSLAMWLPCFDANAHFQLINPVDRGDYANDGGHVPSSVSYSVGNFASHPAVFRNFFVFDLSSINDKVVNVELQLLFTGFASLDPTETYTFYDITTPWTELLNGDAEVAGYDDLGTGTIYGQHTVSDAVEGVYFSVFLNEAAIAEMNLATGLWGIGGAFTSLDGNINTTEAMAIDPPWESDLTSTRLIITTIPAPAPVAALGVAAMTTRRRRRS
jgi:hypothetical protein